jgi:hypothetical protein
MHAIGAKNIDASSQCCRDRGNKYGKASIVQFFNDEGRDQGLFNLCQVAGVQVASPLSPGQALS